MKLSLNEDKGIHESTVPFSTSSNPLETSVDFNLSFMCFWSKRYLHFISSLGYFFRCLVTFFLCLFDLVGGLIDIKRYEF